MSKNLLNIYSKVVKNDEERRENDFYPTPPLAVYTLLKNYSVPKNILEPCAGQGDISYELIRNGHEVISTDLYKYDNSLVNIESGIDFLQSNIHADGVITNPPYNKNLPLKMLKKCIQEYDFTAFLLRITFLEGGKRYIFFKNNPPSKILVFSDRLRFSENRSRDFYMNKQIGGMICYAWFIWDKNNPNKNEIDWVKAFDYYDNWRNSLNSNDYTMEMK